jgi:transposase
MVEYIGLDVSLKGTAISIRKDGKRIWRGRCSSEPKLLAEMIRKHAPHAKRVVFETGPLSTWFYHALTDEGVPAICIEARHAQKVLDETLNKTDANDADGLAHLAEAGFYKAVRVKAFDSMLTRTLVAARNQLLSIKYSGLNHKKICKSACDLRLNTGSGSASGLPDAGRDCQRAG